MGSMSVSSCICCMFVHPVVVLNAGILRDLQCVNAGRGCKRRPYGRAPNDTAYKRWSCHSGFKLLCKLCRTSPPPAIVARFTVFLGMPAMRTRWMAGAAAHKSG